MSSKHKIQLTGKKIPHKPHNEYDEAFRKSFNIEHKCSVAVGLSRDDAAVVTVDADANAVLLLELQDGVMLIVRRDDFEKDFPAAASRSADGTIVFPTHLDLGSPSRGFKDWIIKALHVFVIKKTARKVTAALIKSFEDKLDPGPGFYQIEQADKVKLIPGTAPTANDAPLLVFIHGTASSTDGSFGGLWSDQPMLVQALFEHYGQRVFAFEHRTLSEGPVENARALLKQIPAGASVHLVCHSRGGLVGELLSKGTVAEGLPPFSSEELQAFSACAAKKANAQDDTNSKKKTSAAFAAQHRELQALGRELDKKRIKVERFVRVACPTRGTTLASGRLDRWLSIMLNLIGLVPALGQSPYYGLLKNFALALVENKARPGEIPGLEAQMPDSPLVQLLNSSANTLAADLSVISGAIEKDSLLGRIALLAPNKFYGGEHDLIVNTASMYGGGARAQEGRFLAAQGPGVHHFNYYRNTATASALVKGLTATAAERDAVFTAGLPSLTKPIPRGAIRTRSVAQPVVFIIPGTMGSELWARDTCVWVNLPRLVCGGMDKLNISARRVTAEHIMADAYARLVDYLSATHEVQTFPYDWRKPLSTQVQRLASELKKKLAQQQAQNQPLRIVAHSAGGLLTRLLMSEHKELWHNIMRQPSARFIMLGTPNAGSFAIPRMLLGQDKLIKTLALLDVRNSHQELLDIIYRFPGVLELLPDFGNDNADLFDRETWQRMSSVTGNRYPVPSKAALNKARNFRTLLNSRPLQQQDHEKIIYVAGVAPETPIGLHIENDKVVFKGSPRGDGRVSWDSGIPANISTWYMEALHGDLADHPPAFAAIHELLTHGNTDKLSRQEPAPARGVQDVFDMLPDEVDIYPGQRDLQKTIMGGEYRLVPSKPMAQKVDVFVSHGDLAFARNLVAVGHYLGNGQLFNAEKNLNRCLNNQLGQRLQLGVYPGELETCAIVLNKPFRKPRGAIVIGLGEVGKLSVSKLATTFSYALRNYGMQLAEQRSANAAPNKAIGLKISSLLIGGSAGGLPTRDAVLALLKGTVAANTVLAETYPNAPVYIEELEFIEWFEDGAINVIDILHDFAQFEQDVTSHFSMPTTLRSIGGGRRRIRFAEAPGWWQRLQILQGNDGELRFSSITDRARAEVSLLPTDRKKVDHFLQAATRSTYDDPELAHTLFEMLLPHELKERAVDASNLLLILNEQAARYPWELISDRWANNSEPFAATHGTIRQLEAMHYRRGPGDVHDNDALIIGEPDLWSDATAGAPQWSRLPGALEEAQLVAQRLVGGADAFRAETSFNENGFDILSKLHRKAYRVMHLAGHGVFNYTLATDEGEFDFGQQGVKRTKAISGMVIGSNMFLTPADIEQMRNVPELVFVNCCHLGSTEDNKHRPLYPSLAANLATQFIRMGVRAVVAAGWEVDDGGAKTFAGTFYGALLEGHEFGDAVLMARKATYHKHPGINTWGAYQCYGDPHYTLCNIQCDHDQAAKVVVAPSELVLELDNIRSNAGSLNAKQTAQHVSSLASLAGQASTHGWSSLGDVCAAFGRAYGELDQFELATQWYARALQAEDAKQPLATLEQLANLKIRHVLRSMQRADASKKELAAAERELKASIKILEQLCKPVARIETKTSERLSLLGSAYKRKAHLDITYKRAPIAALVAMRDYYAQSHKLDVSKNSKGIDPYPYSNHLIAMFLLNLFNGNTHPKPGAVEIRTLVELEARVEARDREDPSFWTLVGRADCRLLIHLIKGDLHEHAEGIGERYLNAKTRNASAREFRSIIEQVEFLSVMLNAAPPPKTSARKSSAANKAQSSIAQLLEVLKKEK